MKERPIPCYQHEVKSILAGTQTMLRRVIRPQPTGEFKTISPMEYDCQWGIPVLQGGKVAHICPYGSPGDRLWVRETFAYEPIEKRYVIFTDGGTKYPNGTYIPDFVNPSGLKWLPSIRMPRWASLITLEITSIRVERVQDISIKDVMAEGVPEAIDYQRSDDGDFMIRDDERMKEEFIDLWNSINEKRGFGWDFNPWVWVIEFKKI